MPKTFGRSKVRVDYPGVTFVSAIQVDNPNYLFVNLRLAPTAKVGNCPLIFNDGKRDFTLSYPLQARDNWQPKGLDGSDVMYLLMPDRFANGDAKNDVVKTMRETTLNRDSMYHRHGGDLQGVRDQLDYLHDLGVTALWLNPVLENDQPRFSYHGYASTDHYRVDPRFGTNELYRQLTADCHQRNMKMVMDIIFNHVGDQHWLIRDLPAADWVHRFDRFTRTTYMVSTLLDPYASEHDKNVMSNGWFDTHMPDLNQGNPLLANYLLQNTLWWVEYAHLDGYRLDTYAYADLDFLTWWGEKMRSAYPTLGIFGETWVQGEPIQAYFHGNTILNTPFKSHLPGLTDFQLHYAIHRSLNEPFGWEEGVSRLYYTLSKDYLYKDASHNVTFLDNHDLDRFFSVVGEDTAKFKMGIALLLTLRGIPCLYYGTEIQMKNFAKPDGLVREDFVGGWMNDRANKFMKSGRRSTEQSTFTYVRNLLNWRKQTPAVQTGQLMQFVPENGVYTFFRYNDQQTVMVLFNPTEKAVSINTDKYRERLSGFRSAKEVVTGKTIGDLRTFEVPAKTILLLELGR